MATPVESAAPERRAPQAGAAGAAPGWRHFDHEPGPACGERLAIGLVALAGDRSSEPELRAFLPDDPAVAVYANRVPMAPVVSLDTLGAMEGHIGECVRDLMPDDRLDVIVYGCTSGTMTIGAERVAALVRSARPGVAVVDPISASLAALGTLGARRIALLTPYAGEVNRHVERYVAARGMEIGPRGAFHCAGDPDICRVPPAAILAAGRALGAADVDALFVSCTGLVVSPVLARLEDAIGKPVVASNQAIAWDCLRRVEWKGSLPGRGRLLETL